MFRLSMVSRLVVVIVLIVLSLGFSPLDIRRFIGFPLGEYGFNSTGTIVTRVDSGGPAERAGLHVGDRIAFGDATRLSRYAVIRGVAWSPGDKLSGTVTSGGRTRTVALVADPEPASVQAFVALRFVLAFLTIGIAAALLLTRPEIATWGFFLYSLMVINLPGAVSNYVIPPILLNVDSYVFSIFFSLAGIGGVLFAFAFAGQPWTPWRRLAIAATFTAAAVATLLEVLFGAASDRGLSIVDAFAGLALFMMLLGLIDSYRHDDGASRQRLRWMIAALLIVVPAHYIAGWFYPGPLSYGAYASLIAIQAVLPLTAAYAMFRKRVVDVDFVVSRTLVYGVLTVSLVAIFSLLDAVLSRSFAESRVSLSIDIIVALLLGFSLNSAHRRVDVVIDRVIFRERHRAELQLERSANGIIHASDEDTVSQTLVRLPIEALRLTGAAVYRMDGAAFTKAAASGQFVSLTGSVGRNDALPLYLSSEHQPVRLDSLPLSVFGESHGTASVVLAIPVTMRGELDGFVVYGAHRSGADIDPDEQRALVPLVRNAATAFGHIEAAALRARVATLEAMLLAKAGNDAT
ncbi:MAG TPA: PDZ domain-containing protein [Candidatus Eremiobacteraceae bacterium]|nr:PDZ domain-containing protein [Candidatus Eremiobacteraceae bacterium]